VTATPRRWHRYVALGDSTTEGLEDLDETGRYRGWADRLAQAIANHQGSIEYANLAVRGKTAVQIRDEQLPAALALRPDLVTVVAGMNDVLVPNFNPVAVASGIGAMFRTLRNTGATVLTFTMPDPTPNLPLTGVFQPRLRELNEQLRRWAHRTGAILVEVAAYASQSDPRLWHDDRLHGNSTGHAILAHALAHGLGLPGWDDSWLAPLPTRAGRPVLTDLVAAEVAWAQQHAWPWVWRSVRGVSSGEGRSPKHPEPVRLTAASA
jgi:lysophospholipase L1-like esterase